MMPRRPLPGPWRTLLFAALYILGAVAMQVIAIAVLMLANAPPDWPHHGWHLPRPPGWLVLTVALLALQASFITVAWWRGGREGRGNRRAGLGWAPIRRWRVLLLALPATEAATFLWVLTVRRVVPVHGMRAIADLSHGMPGGPMLRLAFFAVLLALLPAVSEELFFRGWLWQALRRTWRPLPTAVVTSASFLLLHLPNGLSYPLLLLPVGISLALVRHYCGSVRASFALHFTHNMVATGLLWWAQAG